MRFIEDAVYWAERARTASSPESQDFALRHASIYAQLASVEAQQEMITIHRAMMVTAERLANPPIAVATAPESPPEPSE